MVQDSNALQDADRSTWLYHTTSPALNHPLHWSRDRIMNAQQSSSPMRILLALCVAGLIVAFVAVLMQDADNETPEPAPPAAQEAARSLTVEEAADLVQLAQRGNAYLENLQLEQADQIFVDISEQLPRESLGPRNLAITRYLRFEDQLITAEQVEAALAALREREPTSPVADWLAGKTALIANDPEAAVPYFAQAAALAPENPVFWYQLYDAARIAHGDQSDQAKQALARAYALVPDNLYSLGDWLLMQARTQDPEMIGTLGQAAQTVAPLRDLIEKKNRGLDIVELLQQTQQAAEAGQWQTVLRNTYLCNNVIRPQDFTQSDKRALLSHPLELMQRDFSNEFQEKYPRPPPPADLIDVAFAPFSSEFDLPVREPVRQVVLVDLDLDARLDALVLGSNKLQLFHRAPDQQSWRIATSVDVPEGATGLLVADLDTDRDTTINRSASEGNDGPALSTGSDACFEADADVVVFGESGLTLLRNELDAASGARTLQPVEQSADFASVTDVVAAVLVDVDHDSNLDIVCSTQSGVSILLSLGALTFTDVSRFSVLPDVAATQPITSLVPVDWDRDVDIDIVAVAPGAALGYFENLRHGNFRWREFPESYELLRQASSLQVIDGDANVSWDVVGVGATGVAVATTSTAQPGTVQLMETRAIASTARRAGLNCDLDNNGFQDIFAWGDGSLTAWRGAPQASFHEMPILNNQPAGSIQGCDFGDVDNDGDLDLVTFGDAGAKLYRNEGGNRNNWLSIRAMGTVDNAGKSNHHGLGSLIEVKAGSLYQAQTVTRPVTHFGLGQQPRANIVRFLWTNGVPQDQIDPAANQVLCEPMDLKGSCPYIYTWTGDRYEFFTDCLWAAPIGLQLFENVLAPTRSWEYLKIPGDCLRAKDGRYWLQITEELWEAGYFDHVRLIAVDHPADVEVFSNEKVGPASIADFKLHTVCSPRLPVTARDQRGRDVMPLLRERDGHFLKAFDKRLAPGLVEEHYLELDLGELTAPERITLFLTGWIYPTDTSRNVALSRHPQLAVPRPPAVFIPDAEGNWRQVQPYMGFPGGKTKTIAVDLSKTFLTDDYRLRIVTTNEIYWDAAFFTVDEQPAELRLTELALVAADLHPRGFSDALPQAVNAPQQYDYARVSTNPKWPPMQGRFTRYGEVQDLLRTADDQMVVLASGDELTVSFEVPLADPPSGWVRDFIMHNIGWDKDADLHTVYGQTVEPLPFREMRSYPYEEDEHFPDTAEHQRYLRDYQSREQSRPAFWRRIKVYGE